jgi:glyoxylase-like metal-dependent hydrolase (beta-lactamase superfamily II)
MTVVIDCGHLQVLRGKFRADSKSNIERRGEMSLGKAVMQTKRLKIYEVADGVYAAITPNRGWGWVDAGFITRGKGLVWDTMYDLPHAHELLKAFQELSGLSKPEYVVISHADGDHIFGNQLFKDSTIIMHEKADQQLRRGTTLTLYDTLSSADPDNKKLPAFVQYYANEFRGLDFRGIELHGADVVLPEGADLTLYLEGMRCEILNVAPGHSTGDLLLWLPQERIVFTGDIVFSDGGIVAHSEEGMKLWAVALDKIIELNPRVIVPGHGGLCDVEYVKKLRGYFDFVLKEFDKHYEQGKDPVEITKEIDITEYANWLQPERLSTVIEALAAGRDPSIKVPSASDPVALNESIERLLKVKAFYEEKYKDIIKPWDPMSSWVE